MKNSDHIKAFLDWLREVRREYNIAVEDEREANDQTQDILHSLEFDENGYHQSARLSRALRNIRRNRRMAKVVQEKLRPVLEWEEDNPETVKSLEKLLGAVRKAEKCVEGRRYTRRTDAVQRALGEVREEGGSGRKQD